MIQLTGSARGSKNINLFLHPPFNCATKKTIERGLSQYTQKIQHWQYQLPEMIINRYIILHCVNHVWSWFCHCHAIQTINKLALNLVCFLFVLECKSIENNLECSSCRVGPERFKGVAEHGATRPHQVNQMLCNGHHVMLIYVCADPMMF